MELLVTETLGLGKRIDNTFAGSQMDALLLLPSLLIAANALRHRFRLDIQPSQWNKGLGFLVGHVTAAWHGMGLRWLWSNVLVSIGLSCTRNSPHYFHFPPFWIIRQLFFLIWEVYFLIKQFSILKNLIKVHWTKCKNNYLHRKNNVLFISIYMLFLSDKKIIL